MLEQASAYPACPHSAYWPTDVIDATSNPGCIFARLKSNKKDEVAWTALASLFESQQRINLAKAAIGQARSIAAKVSPAVRQWWYLGPFTIGKHEIDGDPAFEHPYFGPHTVPISAALSSEVRFFLCISVLMYQLVGSVSWRQLQGSTESAHVAPSVHNPLDMDADSLQIDWNDIVGSLGSTALLEHQGWLWAAVAVPTAGDVSVKCQV